MINQLANFLQEIVTSIENQTFIKITLGNKREKSADLKNVFIKQDAFNDYYYALNVSSHAALLNCFLIVSTSPRALTKVSRPFT